MNEEKVSTILVMREEREEVGEFPTERVCRPKRTGALNYLGYGGKTETREKMQQQGCIRLTLAIKNIQDAFCKTSAI